MVPAGVGPFELVCGKFWIIGQFFRGSNRMYDTFIHTYRYVCGHVYT
jgi:hypothetical protein